MPGSAADKETREPSLEKATEILPKSFHTWWSHSSKCLDHPTPCQSTDWAILPSRNPAIREKGL